MKAAPFSLAVPDSIDEAVACLSAAGSGGRVLAGGQSLLPLMVMRLQSPAVLVDLRRVSGLDHVRVLPDGGISIGAMTRQRTVERSDIVADRIGLLREAVGQIAHATIRNAGTVGGSLAHADPTAELPAVALATNATMVVNGPLGARSIGADDFFRGLHRTAIEAGEVLVELRFPADPVGAGTAFVEVSRRPGDVAIVGVAAMLHLDQAGRIDEARIAISSVARTPLRLGAVETMLIGEHSSAEVLAEAGALVAVEIDPPTDLNGTATYRRHLAGVLVRRALTTAAARIDR